MLYANNEEYPLRGKRFHFLLYILPIKIYYLVVILCEKSINNMYSPLLVIKC